MINLNDLINLDRLKDFYNKLKEYLTGKYYDKSEVDSLIPDTSDLISNDDLGDLIIDLYDSTKSNYAVDNYVIYQKRLYRCKTANTRNLPTNTTDWEKVNVIDTIDKKIQDNTPDLTPYVTEIELGDVVAQQFASTSLPYAAGSFVIYNRKLYRCKTQVTAVADFSNTSKTEQVLATNIFSGSAPGLVPAATAEDAGKTLMGDGSWGRPMSATASYNSTTQEFHLDFSNGG